MCRVVIGNMMWGIKYRIGDIVYHVISNTKGIITEISITGDNGQYYTIKWENDTIGQAFNMELSDKPYV